MMLLVEMFIAAAFVLLDISLANSGPNHFVNREMALHAKELDAIYPASKPGISSSVIEVLNIYA